jgi:hypothetical protein
MELLTWRKEEPRIERALAWPVFEAKSFTGGRMTPAQTDSSEPREYAIGAVTGGPSTIAQGRPEESRMGGKPDIILLIHDRILIYKQE